MWVVWHETAKPPLQKELLENAEVLDGNTRLAEEVLAILRRQETPSVTGKRVYVIDNREEPEEIENATCVVGIIGSEFQVVDPGSSVSTNASSAPLME